MNKEVREATSTGRETYYRLSNVKAGHELMREWSRCSTLRVVVGSFVPYFFEHHPLIGAIPPRWRTKLPPSTESDNGRPNPGNW